MTWLGSKRVKTRSTSARSAMLPSTSVRPGIAGSTSRRPVAKCAARVEQDAGRVIRPKGADLRLGVFVELHRPHDLVVELFDGDVASGREMIGTAAGAVRRLYHSAGEVMHKHEIAARLGDKTSLPLRQPVEKDRQRTADIARPDDIGEPKRNPVDTAVLDIMLARGLGDRVAAVDRINRVIERD